MDRARAVIPTIRLEPLADLDDLFGDLGAILPGGVLRGAGPGMQSGRGFAQLAARVRIL